MSDEEIQRDFFQRLDDRHEVLIRGYKRMWLLKLLVCLAPLLVGHILLGVSIYYLVPNDMLPEDHVLVIDKEEAIQRFKENDTDALKFDTPIFTLQEVWYTYYFLLYLTFMLVYVTIESVLHSYDTVNYSDGDSVESFMVIGTLGTPAGAIAFGPYKHQKALVCPVNYSNFNGISGTSIDQMELLHKAQWLNWALNWYEQAMKKVTSAVSSMEVQVHSEGRNSLERER